MKSFFAHLSVFISMVLSFFAGLYTTEEMKGPNISDVGVPMYEHQTFSMFAGITVMTSLAILSMYLVSILFRKNISSLSSTGIVSYAALLFLLIFYASW